MAVIAKKDQDPDPGAAPPNPDGGGDGAAPATATTGGDAQQPKRHNLPLKAAPVVGRKPEMQRMVGIFDLVRRRGGPSRVEVVGPRGVGASTVAIELARRAGHRFPGGAWYVHLGMGADVAWAQLGALRDDKPVKNLADAARAARERLGEEPKSLLVLDGATSADETTAALPPAGPGTADVFVVGEKPIGTVDPDQICEVAPVPRHGARRIALSMIRQTQPDAKAPAVRTLDGLAVTASLAARVALATQDKEGPHSFADVRAAVQSIARFVMRNQVAQQLLVLSAVAHPVGLPVDVLYAALASVSGDKPPSAADVGQGVMWLAHAGLVDPMDERRFSMHPMLQGVVQELVQPPAVLDLARAALATGLVSEAQASISDAGVDLPRCALHQLRFIAATTTGDAQANAKETLAKVHAALGVNGTAASA